jgi:hypothetical protein
MGDGTILSNANLIQWRQHLDKNVNKENLPRIMERIMSSAGNSNLPLGLALRQFAKMITLNIHGTALIPPYTLVDLQGALPGVDGLYYVVKVNDELSPGSFKSTIGCQLLDTYKVS